MRVLIVGGGFGGISAARWLLRHTGYRVTLINPTNFFLFVPLLHEVATGSLPGHLIKFPIRRVCKGKMFRFLIGEAACINSVNRFVNVNGHKISYDYLILANGSKAKEIRGCFPLKTYEHSVSIKRGMILACEKAISNNRNPVFAIVGGGPTGIELSMEIKELAGQVLEGTGIRPIVCIYHAGESILSNFEMHRPYAGTLLREADIKVYTRTKIKWFNEGYLETDRGRFMADMAIGTGGVVKNIIKGGYYRTNDYLQTENEHIFAVGDCADSSYPLLAQMAFEQGKHAARNIYLHTNGKRMAAFNYKIKGLLLSLGRKKCIAQLGRIRIKGFAAWWLMRTIYLFRFPGIGSKFAIAYEWTLNLFSRRDINL